MRSRKEIEDEYNRIVTKTGKKMEKEIIAKTVAYHKSLGDDLDPFWDRAFEHGIYLAKQYLGDVADTITQFSEEYEEIMQAQEVFQSLL